MALLSHHRFEVSCFSSYNICLFSISITRSSSFPVIHVSVNIKNNVEKDETLLLFFLSKRRGGHSISFQIKPWVAFRLPYLLIELFYIGIPVVRTDSRAGGRSGGRPVYGHVITNFSRMGSLPHFLTHGAPRHTRELRYNWPIVWKRTASEISSHLSEKGRSRVFALNKLKNHTSIWKGKGRKRKSKEESVNVELDGD